MMRKKYYNFEPYVNTEESFSFHSNGEVASYFKRYPATSFYIQTMEQCTYDTSGNVLTSFGGIKDLHTPEIFPQTPDCANGVTIPDPTSYLESPDPLTDDGTSHTPAVLPCTP